jgi:arylsulfatase A-like enzyme
VVEEPVRLIDVMPTVLDVIGRPIPRSVDGCSLLPLLRTGREEPDGSRPEECRIAVIEIAEDPGRYPTVAIRTAGWKLIHREGGPDELYDLLRDPAEKRDLLAQGALSPPPVAETLLRRALAVVASRPTAGERIELDEATIEQLKALGYL